VCVVAGVYIKVLLSYFLRM